MVGVGLEVSVTEMTFEDASLSAGDTALCPLKGDGVRSSVIRCPFYTESSLK